MVHTLDRVPASATRYVSLEAVAEQLDVTVNTVRNWIKSGRLTGYRVGPRVVRVDAAQIEQLIQPMPASESCDR